jgi:LysR family transcriptional regulator, carnitine catabolism transcriptional activator
MSGLPNLSVRQLIAVTTVAKYSSFIAAASEMRLSQPGLSRIIRATEDELGFTLFDRTTRQVALTSAGAEFVPVAERILHDLDLGTEALRGLSEQTRGHISIACPMSLATLVLSKIIVSYKKAHPNITIQVLEGIQSGTIDDVRSGRADFGIAYTPSTSEDFVTETLCEAKYHVVFRKDHRFATCSSVSLQDLEREPLISLPPTSNLRRLFDGAATHQGVRLHHTITVNTFSTLSEFVRSGVGVSIVPTPWLTGDKDLLSRPIDRPNLATQLAILRLRTRPLSAAASHLRDLIKAHFQ